VGNNVDGKWAHTDGKQAHMDGKQAHTDGKWVHRDSKWAHADSEQAHMDGELPLLPLMNTISPTNLLCYVTSINPFFLLIFLIILDTSIGDLVSLFI
jgi:hypothetical protein